jgi:hypothetical protein
MFVILVIKDNYRAFIPDKFPPKDFTYTEPKIIELLPMPTYSLANLMV